MNARLYYLTTWAGMFVTVDGGLSAAPRDAATWPRIDQAMAAADKVDADLLPVLIGIATKEEKDR